MRNRARIGSSGAIQFPRIGGLGAVLLGILLFLPQCFEYEEDLHLAPNYGGYVDYKYKVPLQERSGKSLIAFLPATKENVIQKYGIDPDDKELILEDFASEEVYETDTRFPRKKVVRFRIRFKRPELLEKLLIGQTSVYYLDQRLVIQRGFPTSGGLQENSGRIATNFHKYVEDSLKSRALKLSVSAPWYYNVYANVGATAGPGRIYYNLPLEATVNRPNPSLWRIEIKANPMPEDGPGNVPGQPILLDPADSGATD
ncbi:MAG: hypothetical protein KDK33_12460 [Leptospiraceae bacterium]|nr:hypothetical protein [Leptospiraceae bacterium]